MTTIAVDESGLVCADTQLTSDNYILRVCKLFRLPDGGVITASGMWCSAYPWIQWFLAPGGEDRPTLTRGTEVLIVKGDQSIWLAEGDGPPYPILDTTIALGCGRDIARAALARGETALDAVREACRVDAYTSDPVQTMQVLTPAELPGAVTHVSKRKPRRAG